MNKSQDFSYKKNGNNKAVLLLHGLTGHPYEMKFFGRFLSKNGFDIYCPVLPGHGCGINKVKEFVWQDWVNFALKQYDLLKFMYDEVYVAGLCLGAVLACIIGEERKSVSGICGLSTTLFLDGWEMPWYKFLMHIGFCTVFKFFYVFPELTSYGIKNPRLSKKISEMAIHNKSLLNCVPMVSFQELLKVAKFTMKNVKNIRAPLILFHSMEDNLTSIKSSEFIYKNASSARKRLIKLWDCYHVITLDNEKEYVAKQTVDFFNKVSKYNNQKNNLRFVLGKE